jgi:hypothetical protein
MPTLYRTMEGPRRYWVALRVKPEDIRSFRVDARRPGIRLFSGLWYQPSPGTSAKLKRDFLAPAPMARLHRRRADSVGSYGKAIDFGAAKPVGRVGRRVGAYIARKLG